MKSNNWKYKIVSNITKLTLFITVCLFSSFAWTQFTNPCSNGSGEPTDGGYYDGAMPEPVTVTFKAIIYWDQAFYAEEQRFRIVNNNLSQSEISICYNDIIQPRPCFASDIGYALNDPAEMEIGTQNAMGGCNEFTLYLENSNNIGWEGNYVQIYARTPNTSYVQIGGNHTTTSAQNTYNFTLPPSILQAEKWGRENQLQYAGDFTAYPNYGGCIDEEVYIGSGAYYTMKLPGDTKFNFSFTNGPNANGFEAKVVSGGAGATSQSFTSNQTGWYSGTDEDVTLEVRAKRSNCNWACEGSKFTIKTTHQGPEPAAPQDWGNGSSSSNQWTINVYDNITTYLTGTYNSNADLVGELRGYYTQSQTSSTDYGFDTKNKWDTGSNPSNANNYVGCPVRKDYFTFQYKRKGFPCGIYKLTMVEWDDACRIFIDGVEYNFSGQTTWFNNGPPVEIGNFALGENTTVEVRVAEGSGGSRAELKIEKVAPTFLSSDKDPTICQGDEIELTASVANGTANFEWSPDTDLNTTSGETVIASPSEDITYNVVQEFNEDGCLDKAPEDGLIAWWPLDEDADDVIGGANGTVTGASLTEAYNLKGYKFDGGGQKITVPHNALLSSAAFGTSNNFTLSAWVKPTEWVNYSSVITKASGGNWSNSTSGIWLASGGLYAVLGSNVGGNPADSYVNLSYKPELNQWHHVAMVADGTNIILYVDGVNVDSAPIANVSHSRSENNNPITIGGGRVNSSTSEYFPGIIDDVKIYDRGLSSDEISSLYYSPSVRVRVNSTSTAPDEATATPNANVCPGTTITLNSTGGDPTAEGVHVWYAAAGEEEIDPHDGCDEEFVELWNNFNNYDSQIQNITFPHAGEFEINNGIISCDVTGEDPWIWMFPLPGEQTIDADVYKYVNVRYRVTNFVGNPNNPSHTRMGANFTKNGPVYPTPPTSWGGTDDPTYPYPFSQPDAGSEREQINIDGDWHVVAIPVHEHANWFGDITGLRLDFFDPYPHDENNGSTMDIDFVTVSKHPMIGEGKEITLTPDDQYYPEETTTYYSKIIDNCGPTDCATVTVEMPQTGNVLAGDNETSQCYVNGNYNVHFYSETTGNYIGAINPNGREGLVKMTSYVNTWGTNPGVDDGTMYACGSPTDENHRSAYMKRVFVVDNNTLSPSSNDVKVYLPFSGTELTDLANRSFNDTPDNDFDNVSGLGDVAVTKFDADPGFESYENGTPTDNCDKGTRTKVDQVENGVSLSLLGLPTPVTGRYIAVEVNDFSEFAFMGNGGNALPIELTKFAGECQANNALIRWTTASESNVNHYEVERSRNGTDWELVGKVNAQGNTNVETNYELVDNENFPLTYYRLRNVDYDGKTEEFGPISVQCGKGENTWKVFPNPLTDKGTVILSASSDFEDIMQITDINGRILQQKEVKITAGTNMIEINTKNLVKGVYVIHLLNKAGEYIPIKFVAN